MSQPTPPPARRGVSGIRGRGPARMMMRGRGRGRGMQRGTGGALRRGASRRGPNLSVQIPANSAPPGPKTASPRTGTGPPPTVSPRQGIAAQPMRSPTGPPGLMRAVSTPGARSAPATPTGCNAPVGMSGQRAPFAGAGGPGEGLKRSQTQPDSVSTVAASDDTIIMAGWLEKKGSKRWFSLTAVRLTWCQNQKSEPIGQLSLARTRFSAGPKKLQFTLTTAQKQYTLSAKTEELAQQWMRLVQRHIEAANAAQQQRLADAVNHTHRRHGTLKVNGTKSFVVLDDVRLRQYKSEADATARKPAKWELHLSGCKVMENAHGKPFFYVVSLHNKHKQIEFGCGHPREALEWVETLTSAIAKANHAGPQVALTDVTVGSGVSVDDVAGMQLAEADDDAADDPTDLAELYKDGFLEKKGSQRWFLFNGEKLSWAMQPTTTDFIGTIQLSVTEVVGGPKPSQFTLKTPAKNYVLTAKTPAVAKAWCDILQKGRLRGRQMRQSQIEQLLKQTVILHEGALAIKKTKRYFLLQNETLSCYADADACHNVGLPANKGMWDLFNARVVEEVHAHPLLYLESDEYRLELAADSKKEASKWATYIAAGIERANKRGALRADGKLSKADRQKKLEEQESKAARQRKKAEEDAAAEKQKDQIRRLVEANREVLLNAMCGPGILSHQNTTLTVESGAPSHAIFLSLGNAYLNDELVRAMVRCSFHRCSHATFLDAVMCAEIDACSVDTTLFRTDSLATKSAGAYLKLIAKQYLINTLGGLVQSIAAAPAGYEINPDKIPAGEDRNANMSRLTAKCGEALEMVTSSLPDAPPAMRVFLEQLKARVEAKFAGSRLKAIGAFVFLRFMQPSIFAPEGFGLMDSAPSRDARRAMTLVAKVMQNLANGVKFGKKEAFMEDLNSFVMAHVEELFYFLDELSSTHGAAQQAETHQAGAAMEAFDDKEAEAALCHIVLQLHKQRERVMKELNKRGADQSPQWRAVAQVLDQLQQQ